MAEVCIHSECKREAEVSVMLQFPCGDATVKALLNLRFCPRHGGTFAPNRLMQQGYASFLNRHFEKLGLPRPSLQAVTCRTRPISGVG